MEDKDRKIDYWKKRCLLAEATLDGGSFSITPTVEEPDLGTRVPRSADYYVDTDGLEALNLLAMNRIAESETASQVVRRLLGYMQDRMLAIDRARRSGIPMDPETDYLGSVCAPLVERLLKDLSSGRQTIEFLSRPPAMRVDGLPVGTVFTTNGRLLELRREPAAQEACVTCYEWNRDERPAQVDRKQLVQPIGRVTFDDRRKTIKLGLLEIAEAASRTLDTEVPPPMLPEASKNHG